MTYKEKLIQETQREIKKIKGEIIPFQKTLEAFGVYVRKPEKKEKKSGSSKGLQALLLGFCDEMGFTEYGLASALNKANPEISSNNWTNYISQGMIPRGENQKKVITTLSTFAGISEKEVQKRIRVSEQERDGVKETVKKDQGRFDKVPSSAIAIVQNAADTLDSLEQLLSEYEEVYDLLTAKKENIEEICENTRDKTTERADIIPYGSLRQIMCVIAKIEQDDMNVVSEKLGYSKTACQKWLSGEIPEERIRGPLATAIASRYRIQLQMDSTMIYAAIIKNETENESK